MKARLIGVYLLCVSAFASCTTGDHVNIKPGRSKLQITINHSVDGKNITWDSVMYTNQAGNQYSVERLQYYLSDFRFYRNGSFIFSQDSVFFIDARNKPVNLFTFNDIPQGGYDSIAFVIGVKQERNKSYSLPATKDNVDMAWPDMMGGGYHFLKLEGHFKDGLQRPGFAMHIGSPGYQVHAGVVCDLHLDQYNINTMSMTMNVNEWFRSPNIYDLGGNNSYSMGNGGLMSKLQQNGANAFHVD